jgi:hypothetical protein
MIRREPIHFRRRAGDRDEDASFSVALGYCCGGLRNDAPNGREFARVKPPENASLDWLQISQGVVVVKQIDGF